MQYFDNKNRQKETKTSKMKSIAKMDVPVTQHSPVVQGDLAHVFDPGLVIRTFPEEQPEKLEHVGAEEKQRAAKIRVIKKTREGNNVGGTKSLLGQLNKPVRSAG